MELTPTIATRAGLSVIHRANMELIRSQDADRFVEACLDARTVILGIEGFYLDGEAITPRMDAIADFSGIERADDAVMMSVASARAFLQAVSDERTVFEFVLRM
jgi:hypothetical protein